MGVGKHLEVINLEEGKREKRKKDGQVRKTSESQTRISNPSTH